MKSSRHLIACLILLLALNLSVVNAQGALDPAAEPSGGIVGLAPAFMPDPYRVPLVGGGDVDTNSRALGADCFGFISIASDFRVVAQDAFPLLRFIYIADTITSDTTLIVRTPDGRFLCNNDSSGTSNPMVSVTDAMAGDYAIWIGGFSLNSPVYGDLYVTANSRIIPGSTGVVIPLATSQPLPTATVVAAPTPLPGIALNPNLTPAHGRVSLSAGFLPDPYWSVVVGGGTLPVPPLNDVTIPGVDAPLPACGGFTDSAPDFRLDWSGRSTRLRFHFVPVAANGVEPDAALIVQAPDGSWNCNRDFAPGFSRPSAEFINPAAGIYSVWVADEDLAGTSIAGVIYVSEITSTPETVRQAATLPVADVFGLDTGEVTSAVMPFSQSPDPLVIPSLTAGGMLDINEVNPDLNPPGRNSGCTGFYSNAPTVVLNLEQPTSYLRTFFVASETGTDPTLIVRMPDGQWYCNDDSFDTKSPTVNIIGNGSSGIMRIWIGSFDAESFPVGSLYVTRGTASPSRTETSGVAGVATATLAIADFSTTPLALPTSVVMPTTAPMPNAAGLDTAGEASYGTVSLGAAFVPHSVAVSGGGAVDVMPLGGECVGFVTAQPDYRVLWSGGGSFLRFFMTSLDDTTLIVYAPDGTWHCNDDSFVSVNPTVDITSAVPGTYSIWIGSYQSGIGIPGTLSITEDASRNPMN